MWPQFSTPVGFKCSGFVTEQNIRNLKTSDELLMGPLTYITIIILL